MRRTRLQLDVGDRTRSLTRLDSPGLDDDRYGGTDACPMRHAGAAGDKQHLARCTP
jgi:hypothetical protein